MIRSDALGRVDMRSLSCTSSEIQFLEFGDSFCLERMYAIIKTIHFLLVGCFMCKCC